MKASKILSSRKNRKIHNPFKRRNSNSSNHNNHNHNGNNKKNHHRRHHHHNHYNNHHNQILYSTFGGLPHDFEFEFSTSMTEPTTVCSSRRSSIIYCDQLIFNNDDNIGLNSNNNNNINNINISNSNGNIINITNIGYY